MFSTSVFHVVAVSSQDEGSIIIFPVELKEREGGRGGKGEKERTERGTSKSASLPIHDDEGSAAGKHLILGARRYLIPCEFFDTPS